MDDRNELERLVKAASAARAADAARRQEEEREQAARAQQQRQADNDLVRSARAALAALSGYRLPESGHELILSPLEGTESLAFAVSVGTYASGEDIGPVEIFRVRANKHKLILESGAGSISTAKEFATADLLKTGAFQLIADAGIEYIRQLFASVRQSRGRGRLSRMY